jgi:tetratricopeptide (TPR) repeat protein
MITPDKPLNLEGLAPIVGLRIREARTDKGMSQKDLVGERFSKSYISSIERGKITPSLKALEYIARRLEVSVSYLLTGVHPNQQFSPNGTGNYSLDEPGDQDSVARWDLVLCEAKVLREQRRYDQARQLLHNKVRVRQLGVEQLKQYHFTMAQLCIDLDDAQAALSELETARELAEKTGDGEILARIRQLIGLISMRQGKPVPAIEQLRLALQAIEAETIKDFHFRLAVYSQLGVLHHQLGDDKEAEEMYRQALQLAGDSAQPEKLAALYWNLAATSRDDGNSNQAKIYATRSLALYESLADMRMLTELRSGFGVILLEARQFEQAEEQFQVARKLAVEHNDLIAQTIASIHLTDLYLEKNDLDKAQLYSQEIEHGLDQLEPALQGQALSSRASLLAAQGQNDAAIGYFQQAVTLIESTSAKELLSKIYFRYARALNARGDTARAAEMFERAYRQLGRSSLVADR